MAGITVRAVASIPDDLRIEYLAALAEPQELHVEQLVAAGHGYTFGTTDEVHGYAIVTDEAIVEFHVRGAEQHSLSEHFGAVLAEAGAHRALCKSFDAHMMTAATSWPAITTTAGFLFRDIGPTNCAGSPELRPRVAEVADADLVWKIHDGFFEDREEIQRYTASNNLYLYETSSGELVGCGILTRVIAGTAAVDIGMVVASAHRRMGIGASIASHLKNLVVARGDRPICGCSAENQNSRRALENAGFVMTHHLVEFTY